MTPVPRAADGGFLPPGFRLDSVPAAKVVAGDRVSWNIAGRAEVCEVLKAEDLACHGLLWQLRNPAGLLEIVHLRRDTTVNRVEVLR